MNRSVALLLLLSFTSLTCIGCQKGVDTATNHSDGTPLPGKDGAAGPGDKPPPPPSADVLALAQGNNEFAFDLYRRLAARDGNVVFSPYSISTALAMTYAGARGDTAAEMEKTLHFPLKPERLHPAFADLARRVEWSGRQGAGKLLIADSLWGQKGYPLRDDFLSLTRDDYGAEMTQLDFQRDTEGARRTINGWVEHKTDDMIPELLKPGMVTGDTKLVLVNAVYLHSLWATPFPAEWTKEGPFRTAEGTNVQTPLMHLTADFQYYEGDGVQVLELPYKGDRLSMVVILPLVPDSVAEVERGLTAPRIQDWLAKLHTFEVETTLPKFTAAGGFGLGEEFQALGMRLAFKDGDETQRRADFSGISNEALRLDHCLHISSVIHQARVEVTEEGTKAAAATAVVMVQPVSEDPAPPPRVVFKADHPFVFVIRDQETRSILFFGRFARPGA